MSKDLYIIGGGVAGLTAAIYAARAGRRVRLREGSAHLGGRARSRSEPGGFVFNLGPHALSNAGAGQAVLDDLAIRVEGRTARSKGALALHGGRAHALPAGFGSLLTTGLLDLQDKLAVAELMGRLPRLDPAAFAEETFGEVTRRLAPRPRVAELLHALGRLFTYTHALERAAAAPVLRQMQLSLSSGVRYLDGGWTMLVQALASAARAAGVIIETSARVRDLAELGSADVILATSPAVAGALLGHRFDLEPVRVACLDLALSGLPPPRGAFGLGIDAPTYVSIHSRYARLAPEGKDVIHAAKYLASGSGSDPRGDRSEIEASVDLVCPGWREHVVRARFLPSLIAAHALPGPRPAVAFEDGVYLAGDWVGDEGLLADAAFASGRRAAQLAGGREVRAA